MAEITFIADYLAARHRVAPIAPQPYKESQKSEDCIRPSRPPESTAILTRTSSTTRDLDITEDYVRSKLMLLEDLVATVGDLIHELRQSYPDL